MQILFAHSFVFSSIHLFNIYLLKINKRQAGTELGTEDTMTCKIDVILCLLIRNLQIRQAKQ